MSARALVAGALFRAPEARTSKAGKPYATFTIREGKSDAVRWWKGVAFSESAIEEVLRLGDGEAIAITGEFDCEIYAPAGGEARLNWKITADAILSARPKPKEARPKANKPPRGGALEKAAGPARLLERELSDDIPF